jgi:hypothetical protein
MKKTEQPMQKKKVEEVLAVARSVRAQVKRELTEKEIDQAKRHGRL